MNSLPNSTARDSDSMPNLYAAAKTFAAECDRIASIGRAEDMVRERDALLQRFPMFATEILPRQ